MWKTAEKVCSQWRVSRPTPRLTGTMDVILEKGTKVWNMLPEEIKTIETENRFKRE